MSGSVSFCRFFYRSSFLRVVVWKNFRERTFVFVRRCLFGVFWCCFAYVFASLLVFFVPDTVLKKFSCCQVWCFWVVVFLPLVVSPTSSLFSPFFFFFFERDSSGSHRAHPHTHLVFHFLFLVFVPRRVCLFTRFGRASFPSGVLSGCHSGPRAFFGFSRDFSETFLLDARRQGCFFASRACVVFPLFVLFCGFFSHDLEGADPSSNEAIPRPLTMGCSRFFCPLRGEIQLLCGMRGKCCPFFEECVSVIPSVCFALFHRISVSNSGLYVGGSYPVFLCAI